MEVKRARPRRALGEQWASKYHDPTFEDASDEQNNRMLVGDIRRVTRRILLIIGIFALVLLIAASAESSLNMLIVAAGPILVVAIAGEVLALWLRRRQRI